MSHEAAFNKITGILQRSLDAATLEESRPLIADALKCTERLAKAVTTAAVKRGRLGGTTTAERMKAKDPDYYKRIAAMRKTKGGGRPNHRILAYLYGGALGLSRFPSDRVKFFHPHTFRSLPAFVNGPRVD